MNFRKEMTGRFRSIIDISLLHRYLAMATYVCPYAKYHVYMNDVHIYSGVYVHA